MSVSLSSHRRSDIVARLRAAGCVFAEDEARLLISEARTPAELTAMVDRRAAGLPLEHVIGWAEFCGLRIAVDPGVFVPRRRTEFLVSQAVLLDRPPAPARPGAAVAGGSGGPPPRADMGRAQARASGVQARASGDRTGATEARTGITGARTVVVDLCCGSGAVGAALAAALGEIELHAADIDPAAAACARRNVAATGGRVYEGDLYDPLPAALRGRVDLLAANVPYVPADEVGLLPPEARTHEPRVALDGGADGLDVLRRVAADAVGWLAPGGHLLTEISDRQAPGAVKAVAGGGLIPRVASSEELNATVIIGTRPARTQA
jgi:release factor glutamine methyltransferase